MKSPIKFLASVIFRSQWLFNQRDNRSVLTKREGRNLNLVPRASKPWERGWRNLRKLDIIESINEPYFYVNNINIVFEYYLRPLKVAEHKIPRNNF